MHIFQSSAIIRFSLLHGYIRRILALQKNLDEKRKSQFRGSSVVREFV